MGGGRQSFTRSHSITIRPFHLFTVAFRAVAQEIEVASEKRITFSSHKSVQGQNNEEVLESAAVTMT